MHGEKTAVFRAGGGPRETSAGALIRKSQAESRGALHPTVCHPCTKPLMMKNIRHGSAASPTRGVSPLASPCETIYHGRRDASQHVNTFENETRRCSTITTRGWRSMTRDHSGVSLGALRIHS